MASMPHVVVRVHRPSEVIAYYQELIDRSRVDLSHLNQHVEAARSEGPTERVIARYDTAEEAEADAARRASTVPGITFRAGWDDSGYDY